MITFRRSFDYMVEIFIEKVIQANSLITYESFWAGSDIDYWIDLRTVLVLVTSSSVLACPMTSTSTVQYEYVYYDTRPRTCWDTLMFLSSIVLCSFALGKMMRWLLIERERERTM